MGRHWRFMVGILGAVVLIWMGARLGGWWQERQGAPTVTSVEVAPAR